jgi:phenylalanyl-tRNA synthetase beta chain
MLVSKKLLQTYFAKPLPKTSELCDALTMHAFEIEGVEKKGADDIIDVKVLPNRAHDCLSHRGIAREIHAITGLPLIKTKQSVLPKSSKVSVPKVAVSIKDKRCVRYNALVLDGVEVGPSPKWLKDALTALGQKSINNVVDATNYVMFSIGQPLHAFDYNKIAKDKKGVAGIVVREAVDAEPIVTLTGDEYALVSETMLIADADGALALAGVKGGNKAELDEKTTTIVLESANFDGSTVRRAAQRYSLRTDASKRFEQGITPHLADEALAMVAGIIVDIAGGKNVHVGQVVTAGAKLPEQRHVSVKLSDINRIIGKTHKAAEIDKIWKRLGFVAKTVVKPENTMWLIAVPHERLDITIKEDLVEEVARLGGLYDLKGTLPVEATLAPEVNHFWRTRDIMREVFLAAGFSELMTYSFQKKGEVELRNPLNKDAKFLRMNLCDGLGAAVTEALKTRPEVRVFEFGTIFKRDMGGTSEASHGRAKAPEALGSQDPERSVVNGVIEHRRARVMVGFQKRKLDQYKQDILALKGLAENVGIALGLPFVFTPVETDALADITVNGKWVGSIAADGLRFDLDTIATLLAHKPQVRFKEPSKFPAMTRDIAVWVPLNVRAGDVEEIIGENMGALATSLKFLDIFEQKEQNRKSFAFRIELKSEERTLTDEDANASADSVYAALKVKGWEVR